MKRRRIYDNPDQLGLNFLGAGLPAAEIEAIYGSPVTVEPELEASQRPGANRLVVPDCNGVVLHKRGRYLKIKPNNLWSAAVLDDLQRRLKATPMLASSYYGVEADWQGVDVRVTSSCGNGWTVALNSIRCWRY